MPSVPDPVYALGMDGQAGRSLWLARSIKAAYDSIRWGHATPSQAREVGICHARQPAVSLWAVYVQS